MTPEWLGFRMPGVCDLTPKFRIASTHEKVRKKAGETPCWSIYIWVVFFAITFGLKNTIYLINCRKKIDLVTWTKFASFEYKWNWKACHAMMHNCQEQFFTRLKRVKTKVSKNCMSSSSIWIEFHGFTVLLREDAMLLTREYIRARFLKTHCAY